MPNNFYSVGSEVPGADNSWTATNRSLQSRYIFKIHETFLNIIIRVTAVIGFVASLHCTATLTACVGTSVRPGAIRLLGMR